MKYFIRSLKYFVALCVLCAAIMALNRLSGFATLTLEETFYVMFHTTRGMMLPRGDRPARSLLPQIRLRTA